MTNLFKKKGERPLDTARDPTFWQNPHQATEISPSIIKSDQKEKNEEIKNPEPKLQPHQEQPQQPEIKKDEDKNKPIENKIEKNEIPKKNDHEKSVEKNTLEVQPMDSKEMPPSPNFGAIDKDVVAKKSPKNIQPEISTPIPNKAQEQKNENKITPFAEKEVEKRDEMKNSTDIKKYSDETKVTPFVDKEVKKVDDKKDSIEIKKPVSDNKVEPFAVEKDEKKKSIEIQKPLSDNKVTPVVEKEVQKIDEKKNSIEIKKPLSDSKVTPIPQEKDTSPTKIDNKNSISQEKKSQDMKVTPILPKKDDSKDNKNTSISQEKEKQDLKIPTKNDSEKDIPIVLPEKFQQDLKMPPKNDSQEKIISTVPTNNQNKDSTRGPVPKEEKITNVNHYNPLNLVINPKTNGDTVPQPRRNTSQKRIVPVKENPPKKIESKGVNDSTPYSLVNHGTAASHETKKPQNNNDSSLIETFAKPQNPSLHETSPIKRNTSRSRINLNESKSNISPKLVDKKKNDDSKRDSIPDILDKTDKKMPILNLQPTPIKKREDSKEQIRAPAINSSSRLNDSSLPSLKKEIRSGSKTPFKTNAKEILGSNNPASLTFDSSPVKIESKRDLSRNKNSSKSILDSKLNLIDEKSPAKRENSSLMNKRPYMMSSKGSGANLQLDISRKTKDDYPTNKVEKGYKVPLDSNSSPGLSFNERRGSNILNAHPKYTNDSSPLKLLEQRNRSVGKVDSNEVIFEYSNYSQANIRTKTESNKDFDSMFDISMHTEGNDKSFRVPLRPGRMLFMNPIDNSFYNLVKIFLNENCSKK